MAPVSEAQAKQVVAVRAREPVSFVLVATLTASQFTTLALVGAGELPLWTGVLAVAFLSVVTPLLFRAGATYELEDDTLTVRYAFGLASQIRLPLVKGGRRTHHAQWFSVRGGLPIALRVDRPDQLRLARALLTHVGPELLPLNGPPLPPLPPYDAAVNRFSVEALETIRPGPCLVCGGAGDVAPIDVVARRGLGLGKGLSAVLPACRSHRWARLVLRFFELPLPVAAFVVAFVTMTPAHLGAHVIAIYASTLALAVDLPRRVFDAVVLRVLVRVGSPDLRTVRITFLDPRVRERLLRALDDETPYR